MGAGSEDGVCQMAGSTETEEGTASSPGGGEQPGVTGTKWMIEAQKRCGKFLDRLRADPGLDAGGVARHYIDELDRLHGTLFDVLNRQRCEIDGLLTAIESKEPE